MKRKLAICGTLAALALVLLLGQVTNVASKWVSGDLVFYNPNTGDNIITLGSAGTVAVADALTVDGVTIDSSTMAVSGLTASSTELNEAILTLDIADLSADTTYYMVMPHAGNITRIWSVIDGAVATADVTLTANIGATPITNGVVTIATAASAAGDIDLATPTAANVVTAGQAINFVVAGGGAGGSPRGHVAVVLTR